MPVPELGSLARDLDPLTVYFRNLTNPCGTMQNQSFAIVITVSQISLKTEVKSLILGQIKRKFIAHDTNIVQPSRTSLPLNV